MNNVSLVGRLTKDPELKQARNGTSCCQFQLCVDRGVRNASGERVVDFVPCSVFALQCEFLCRYAKKGNMISLTGKIQTRISQEPTGATRFIVEVVVSSLYILNPMPQEIQKVQNVAPQGVNRENQSIDDPSVPI